MKVEYDAVAVGALLVGGSLSPTFVRRDIATSFAVYSQGSLDSVAADLGDSCISALYTNISCPDFPVSDWRSAKWRGTPDDDTVLASVCTTGCQASLKSWFNTVSSACAGKTLHEATPMRIGGFMWEGWNETCATDPKTKKYCNAIIDAFAVVSNVTDMPRTELCSTCYVRKLAMMQASSYSVYNDDYKQQLEYVYAQCGGSGPTALPPSPDSPPAATTPYCVTNKKYTAVAGDTCGSIAAANSVSGANLYMQNQALIPSCASVPAGVSLCIPVTCATYQVQANDTCWGIEAAMNLMPGAVQQYNSWIDAQCDKLGILTDWYGKSICIGPQGGKSTATPTTTIQPSQTPGNGSIPSGPGSGTGGPGTGYYRNIVAPPEGVAVAKGTTLNCGKWHVVQSGPDCGDICLAEGIPYNLFMAVNPSLSMDDCPGSLVPATALCVGPTPEWDQPPLLSTTTTSVPSGTGTMSSTSGSVVSLKGTSQTTISSSASSTKKAAVSSTSATSRS